MNQIIPQPNEPRILHELAILALALVAFTSSDALAQGTAQVNPDVAKASVNGKYTKLLAHVEVPSDEALYGKFKEYGYYPACKYGNVQCPEGHWVYLAPRWYIWKNKAGGQSGPNPILVKASANGKYANLLTQFAVPGDRANYGDFKDYGYYAATTYANAQQPAGYWVYSTPNWYIWKTKASGASNSGSRNPGQPPMPSQPTSAGGSTPPGALPTSVSRLSAAERQEFVRYHNQVRAEVGVGKVGWSEEIAKVAQEWADHLAATGKFEHRGGATATKYGENIAQGYGNNFSAKSGMEGWYSEKTDYTPGTPINAADPHFFKIGHYTQMVWRDTKNIGAGVAKIQTGPFKGGFVVVCNYDPAGNMTGKAPF